MLARRSPLAFALLLGCAQSLPSDAPEVAEAPSVAPTYTNDDPEGLGDAAFNPDLAEEILDATWYGDVLVSNDAFVLDDVPGFVGFTAPPTSDLVALEFATNARVAALEPGMVIVSGHAGGLLRRVVGVQYDGNTAVVDTAPAVLTDVLYVANHSARIPLTLQGAREAWTYDFSGTTLVSGGSGDARYLVDLPSGAVSLEPSLDWGIDIDWADWDRPWPKVNKANLSVLLDAELDAVLHAAAQGGFARDGEHDLAQFRKDFDFRVGPIPIGGTVAFDVDLVWEAEGSGAVDASIGADIDATLALGGRYDGDWHNASGFDWDAQRLGPTVDLAGELEGRVALRIQADTAWFGAVSADLDAEPWFSARTEASCGALDWALATGVVLDSAVGYEVVGLSGDHRFDTFDWSLNPLASGTFALPEDSAWLQSCGDGEIPPIDDVVEDENGEATGGADVDEDEEDLAEAMTREQCADGVDDDGDGATDCDDSECAARIVCGSECHVWDQVFCGDVITADSRGIRSDRKSIVDAWPINVGSYDGPEIGFSFRAPSTGTVEFELVDADPRAVNHDVMLLSSPTGACHPENAVAWGFDGAEAEVSAGENYIVVVDGYDGDAGEFTLRINCGE